MYSRRRRRPSTTRTQACIPRPPYIAVVAEKPRAAEKIALALGRPVKCRYMGIPYWVLWRNGSRLFIVPSAGHLFGPYSPARGFPVYELEWRPLYEFDKNARHTLKFLRLMEYVLPAASLYINACDYDIEGSVIGYTIIEAYGDLRRYKRMKFSSLSPVEIRRAYASLEGPDTLLVEAGKARHEVDWLWGINVSRALMHAVRRATGRRIILSAGRVQSPTIVEAARRWREINLAIPIPVFTVTVTLEYQGTRFTAHPHGWKPETLREAQEIVAQLRRSGRMRSLGYTSETTSVRPPPAFNLGDLQKEAARLYKFSPMKTQQIAEDLYLDALISYPRTNSQKLPPTIDYGEIIRRLTLNPQLGPIAGRLLQETRGVLRPVQGRKDDPAHPAIHPTGELPKGELDRDHWLIYELIVRRFLAAFSRPARITRVALRLEDEWGRRYASKGVTVEVEGWFFYYPFLRPEEASVPPVRAGLVVPIVSVSYRRAWHKEAPTLSRTSLLAWMESVGIGTEATRARIIETLFRRKYLESRGGRTVVTDLGMMVAQVIEELFPALSKPDLTRELERMLDSIREGRSTRRQVVEHTIRTLDQLLEAYRERLETVGHRLAVSLGLAEPETKCPICGRESAPGAPWGLCAYHAEALERLRKAVPVIAEKLDTTEREALAIIARQRGQTGRWVVETAQYALRLGGLPVD